MERESEPLEKPNKITFKEKVVFTAAPSPLNTTSDASNDCTTSSSRGKKLTTDEMFRNYMDLMKGKAEEEREFRIKTLDSINKHTESINNLGAAMVSLAQTIVKNTEDCAKKIRKTHFAVFTLHHHHREIWGCSCLNHCGNIAEHHIRRKIWQLLQMSSVRTTQILTFQNELGQYGCSAIKGPYAKKVFKFICDIQTNKETKWADWERGNKLGVL
ncbi:uncharacterized protein LOC125779547 [Bactrocera dorsalis]|uniref:Uncharacterized protein LOC125779547 n=1 Tax=Bactrocera dorsalis TaxID=27457 RepID=A0ABM3K5X4_BACDO|nr:uncharacterized protein LOC125779547 [Bactrocera dorsalis]